MRKTVLILLVMLPRDSGTATSQKIFFNKLQACCGNIFSYMLKRDGDYGSGLTLISDSKIYL